jgi:hypothetical protein
MIFALSSNHISRRIYVRVRITRELRGSIDGIQLTHFVPGEVYNVSASIGSYLITERAAEAVVDSFDPPADARDAAEDRPRRRLRLRN